MAVVKELPLKKIKPLPIQTQRGTPPPPPPTPKSRQEPETRWRRGVGGGSLSPVSPPAAQRRAGLLSPTSPSSMGCLFLQNGRELVIVRARGEVGSSAAGLPHLFLRTDRRGSSGRRFRRGSPCRAPALPRLAGAASPKVHLKRDPP